MGFISNLFGRSSDDEPLSSATTVTCALCGDDVAEEDAQDDLCEDCHADDYSGPTYCCGQIYEEGETTCSSCGEPL